MKEVTSGEKSKYFVFELLFHFKSSSIYKLNMETMKVEPFFIASKVNKQKKNLSDLRADYIYVTSKDGSKVPITIERNVKSLPTLDSKPKEPLPVLLYAYGGYGNIEYPKPSPEPLIWCKYFRGLHVTVHVRGGGEKGLFWHAGGYGKNRSNTFDDIVAVAEYL